MNQIGSWNRCRKRRRLRRGPALEHGSAAGCHGTEWHDRSEIDRRGCAHRGNERARRWIKDQRSFLKRNIWRVRAKSRAVLDEDLGIGRLFLQVRGLVATEDGGARGLAGDGDRGGCRSARRAVVDE